MLRSCRQQSLGIVPRNKTPHGRILVLARMLTKRSDNNLIMGEVLERESHCKADPDSALPLGVGF